MTHATLATMANIGAPAPVRAIGWRSLTAICINGMIGAGILILPANIAQLLGGKSLYGYMLAGCRSDFSGAVLRRSQQPF